MPHPSRSVHVPPASPLCGATRPATLPCAVAAVLPCCACLHPGASCARAARPALVLLCLIAVFCRAAGGRCRHCGRPCLPYQPTPALVRCQHLSSWARCGLCCALCSVHCTHHHCALAGAPAALHASWQQCLGVDTRLGRRCSTCFLCVHKHTTLRGTDCLVCMRVAMCAVICGARLC
jgi:hypothetical protein